MVELEAPRFRSAPLDGDPVTASDAPLVDAAKADPAAFGLLYQRYAARIQAYCHRRLSDRESAEDAASVVFQRALANIATCDGRTFRAWLFTIAHNVVTDRHRARKPTASLEAAATIADQAPSPHELAEQSEAERQVRDLLNALPPDQRRVVELRLAGLSGVEIARVLGRSHGAVKKLQARAFATLRAELQSVRTNEEM